MTDLPGEIGGYRVQRVLAEGGRGTVYAALQQRPRRTVALKVIRESVAGAAALRHLQRQAQVMARLRQPGIVQVFEAGTDTIDGDPVAFLVMEYVPRARTILEFLRSVELDHAARLRLFIRIAVAVDHAHRRKIIHHALRPGNVLVDEAGQPKVINFGDPIDRAELAATSLDYVSPEQLDPSPRDLSVRCDVYSLGVIMFEMLTETRPYELQGLSADTALDVIRDNEPVRPSTVVPEVSAPLESVILRAISTSPAQRYPNAGELAKAVHQFLETGGAGRREPAGSEPATPSEPKPLPRPRLWPAMVIAVVVLGLVGGGIYLTREQWWPKPVDPPTPPSDVNAGSGGPSPQPGPAPPPAMFPLLGHTGDVVGLRFAPGGVMLATGSADRSLILYDLESRETVLTLEDLLPTAAFTADGTRMLVAAEDAAEIRDTATGRVLESWPTGGRSISAAAVTAQGWAAVALDDLTVRLVDVSRGGDRVFRGTTGQFVCVDVDTDGARLAAGSERGQVLVWDVASGKRADRVDVSEVAIIAVTVTDDGTVAAIARDGEAMVRSGDTTVPFDAASGLIVAAAFDDTGRWLVAAERNVIHLWELSDPPRQVWRQPRTGVVRSVAVESGGKRVAVGTTGAVWITHVSAP